MALILGAVAFSVAGQLCLKSGAQNLAAHGRMASVNLYCEQVRRVHVVGTLLIVIGIAFLLSGD